MHQDVQPQENNQPGALLGLLLIGGLVGYAMIKDFANAYTQGDFEAGAYLLAGVLIFCIMLGIGIWGECTQEFIGWRGMLPLALLALWGGLWPAMQIWGAEPFFFRGLPYHDQHLAWWATTYTKVTGIAVILIGGYGYAYSHWRRN
ncbi:hypothetical protein ACI2KR_21565 [Pseudomonas luteola]